MDIGGSIKETGFYIVIRLLSKGEITLKRNLIILTTIICMIIAILPSSKAHAAATKQYGIAIADKYGNYTFYDLNYTDGRSGMKLRLEASRNYVERYIKPYITGDINRYNEYYNTYKCSALPAGPVCSPGRAAIQAALNPAETDYLFFYSDDQGVYHFSVEYVNPKAAPVVSEDSTVSYTVPAIN